MFLNSPTYPGQIHADLMLGGFLLCFIAGFLMTAIPRFTETSSASQGEMIFAVFALLGLVISSLVGVRIYFLLGVLLTLLGLVRYGAIRFIKRKTNPPFSFLFVGMGFLVGLMGFSLLALLELQVVSSSRLFFLGRAMSYQGMVLCFILGVGGRLIPGILGWTEIVHEQRAIYEKPTSFLKVLPPSMLLAGGVFITSFPVESFLSLSTGRVLRALVVGWFAFQYWQLHHFPKTKTAHTLFLWLSSWMILVGSWLFALWTGKALAGLHLIFIGGFSLMTLMISARVTLAHGNQGLGFEAKKLPYYFIGLSLVLAAVTRLIAELDPSIYLSHLGYAALSFFVGLLAWGWFFLPLKEWRT